MNEMPQPLDRLKSINVVKNNQSTKQQITQ